MAESNTQELLNRLIVDPSAIHDVSPRDFELLIAELLSAFGFEITLTPATRDGGRDIVARATSPIPFTLVVEVKRYAPDRKVGVEVVRQLAGYLTDSKAEKGLLVTSSTFTKGAREYVQRQPNIELRDYEGVKQWLEEYSQLQSKSAPPTPPPTKKSATIFPHDESFPRIATAIDDIWSENEALVTRDEIIAHLKADPEVDRILEERGGTEWHIGNSVDWFSQKITAGESEYVGQFRREKVDGKWAYMPSASRLTGRGETELSPIAGPLRVYIDSNAYTAEEKGEILSIISELYHLQAGDRLVIDSTGTAQPVPVHAGSPDGGYP